MSDVSVDIIKNRSGEAPDLPSGANLSGVSTAATLQVTNLNPTHINASGVTTATTFSGSLKSTGTPTLGLGVTINSSGLNISGVATAGIVSATTLFGDGSNLTGVAFSIAPISYNPDVNDTLVQKSGGGIGITFTQRIASGSGDITLRIAGAAGTYVEAFGIAVDTTYTVTVQSTDSGNKYLLNGVQQDDPVLYPGGVYTFDQSDSSNSNHPFRFSITSNGTHGGGSTYSTGVEVNGTPGNAGAYTRITVSASTPTPLYYYCTQHSGMGNFVTIGKEYSISNNSVIIDPTSDLTAGETYHINYPSGIFTNSSGDLDYVGTAYTFGVKPEFVALLVAGRNSEGGLGQNNRTNYSSPTQIPGITWSTEFCNGESSHAIKTDGTLWGWGDGYWGTIGVNNQTQYSSPVQIPGTTWSKVNNYGGLFTAAIKTDGTLWAWGHNGGAQLGQNNKEHYSSPRQIPGTTWKDVSPQYRACMAIKTDGTLWGWGGNNGGQLGLNNTTYYSSPVQIPGTSWNTLGTGDYNGCCVRTDGTLWVWGHNEYGALGINNTTQYSSPKQIPGTNWVKCESFRYGAYATKSDGTLWAWGQNNGDSYEGALGQNNTTSYSSPVQIPGTNWHTTRWNAGSSTINIVATKTDGTLWAWGTNEYGGLAQNNVVSYSSPVQVPGTSWTAVSRGVEMYGLMAIGTI